MSIDGAPNGYQMNEGIGDGESALFSPQHVPLAECYPFQFDRITICMRSPSNDARSVAAGNS